MEQNSKNKQKKEITKIVKLTVLQRIVFLSPSFFPVQGGKLIDYQIKREITRKLEISSKEFVDSKVVDLGEGIIRVDNDSEKEFIFNELEINYINDSLKKIDEGGGFSDILYDIYLKFKI